VASSLLKYCKASEIGQRRINVMDGRSFLGVGLGVGARISGILLTGGLRSALTAAVEGSPGDVADTTARETEREDSQD
jgi:hypothetical protein